MRDSHLLRIARGNPEYVPLDVADLELVQEVVSTETHVGRFPALSGGRARGGLLRHPLREGAPGEETIERTILLADVGSGQMIGDYSMFAESPHASTAVVQEPVTVLRMERDQIIDVLAMRPRIGLRWMSEALKRLACAHERLAVALSGSVRRRIAAYVLSSTDDGRAEITHGGLAEMIGAERASVSTAVGRLRS